MIILIDANDPRVEPITCKTLEDEVRIITYEDGARALQHYHMNPIGLHCILRSLGYHIHRQTAVCQSGSGIESVGYRRYVGDVEESLDVFIISDRAKIEQIRFSHMTPPEYIEIVPSARGRGF